MSFDLCVDTFGVPEAELVRVGRKYGWGQVRKMARYRSGNTRLYYTNCVPCLSYNPLPRAINFDAVNGDVWELELRNPKALFQIASNFHGFEQSNAYQSPESVPLSDYFYDHTQGPAGVIPTSLDLVNRRYLYRGGEYTDEKLLSGKWPLDMLGRLHKYGVDITPGGWADIREANTPPSALEALPLSREVGCVLVENALVTHERNGAFIGQRGIRIHQVLTAALDMNFTGAIATDTSRPSKLWMNVFLFAAYINTLSVARDLKVRDVFLTLVGGGVFSNPIPCIFAAMAVAINSVSFVASGNPRIHIVMEPLNPSDVRSAESYRCLEWVSAMASRSINLGECLDGISSGRKL